MRTRLSNSVVPSGRTPMAPGARNRERRRETITYRKQIGLVQGIGSADLFPNFALETRSHNPRRHSTCVDHSTPELYA